MNPVLFSGVKVIDKSVIERRSAEGLAYMGRVEDSGSPFDERVEALASGVVLEYRSRFEAGARGAFEATDYVRVYFPYKDTDGEKKLFDVPVNVKPLETFMPAKRDVMGRAKNAAFEKQRRDLWGRAVNLAEAAEKAIGTENIDERIFLVDA